MYVRINSTEYEEASIGRLIVVIVGSYEEAWGCCGSHGTPHSARAMVLPLNRSEEQPCITLIGQEACLAIWCHS